MCRPSTLLFLILSIVAIDYLPLASSRVRNLSEHQWCVTALSATDVAKEMLTVTQSNLVDPGLSQILLEIMHRL
ncbi:hypothetical protein Bca4012_001549 [Brassica carinata]|uniref:Uncharacterized protein n=1 Tax=Brassica carinata TaxID=52824 RepID=A0A8X7RZX6_BRACI|nr:hypothetical protein Bca52824_043680 [Brassica carinata]